MTAMTARDQPKLAGIDRIQNPTEGQRSLWNERVSGPRGKL